jgi:hypothetical protein
MHKSSTIELTYDTLRNPKLMRELLERLHCDIYQSWLKDLDKRQEFLALNNLLQKIIESESIEAFFHKDPNNINYFLNKFSKEVINNIVRQSVIPGENGDEIALEVLFSYVRIFLKNIRNAKYLSIYENMKEIFDGSKSFYRCPNSFAPPEVMVKKQMSHEYFNVKKFSVKFKIY